MTWTGRTTNFCFILLELAGVWRNEQTKNVSDFWSSLTSGIKPIRKTNFTLTKQWLSIKIKELLNNTYTNLSILSNKLDFLKRKYEMNQQNKNRCSDFWRSLSSGGRSGLRSVAARRDISQSLKVSCLALLGHFIAFSQEHQIVLIRLTDVYLFY
jgi:hypothetical protein